MWKLTQHNFPSFHHEAHVDVFCQLPGTIEYLLGGGFMSVIYWQAWFSFLKYRPVISWQMRLEVFLSVTEGDLNTKFSICLAYASCIHFQSLQWDLCLLDWNKLGLSPDEISDKATIVFKNNNKKRKIDKKNAKFLIKPQLQCSCAQSSLKAKLALICWITAKSDSVYISLKWMFHEIKTYILKIVFHATCIKETCSISTSGPVSARCEENLDTISMPQH